MKNEKTETKKAKSETTNYVADPHKTFCKRCFSYNRHCPATKSEVVSEECSL